jgi:glutathione gamma-glutamylcysteinyltransferase
LHRRPLPASCIAFSSEDGRRLFRESLESGHLEAFFPLIEQFHTQADPAFCGLGSLVMVLNALGVDPGRVWRGPWRWFSEELLDCCTPLAKVQLTGVTIDEVACLARCNGAEVEIGSRERQSLDELRSAVDDATRSARQLLIVSYCRSALGQTGAGHFSPIGAYHPERDMLLVLDVARFKYPPHWVPLPVMFDAMLKHDAVTGRPRGWLSLRKRARASAVAQFLVCTDGLAIRQSIDRLLQLQADAVQTDPPRTLDELLASSARSLVASGIRERVRLRAPDTLEQRRAFDELAALVTRLPLHERASAVLGPELAGPVVLWWLCAPGAGRSGLPDALQAELSMLIDPGQLPAPLVAEVELLRSQIDFLLEPVVATPLREDLIALGD